eukprot:TRINITY_DN15565_c0_g1_i1.p1 TRINITY_DN15565_c0_g1~~TRINITY_DN15565_c0_g1_i1.p1  ORF type:complete len:220 (-),score=40.45 TRINITY_DN15565_c0_g1_i1:75-734(-)
MGHQVVLLDALGSPFGLRTKIGLAEKGIEYECKEEDLTNKSSLLAETNPVYKKVPVLIHNGKPICESLVILQYIDEVWNNKNPLLPQHPYARSVARFWADYSEKKIYQIGKKIWLSKGEAQEAAKKEYIENWKVLEGELGDKPFFGGESFGFVDVALIPFANLFYALEQFGNFNMNEECSKIIAWVERCRERESVSKTLPHPHKIYELIINYLSSSKPQ